MKEHQKNTGKLKRLGLMLLLILVDIFIVNFSYYMALVLRFYVNHEFNQAAVHFIPLFWKFAPWYTVCCIIVFWFFKLYKSVWRYAGFNDIYRIAAASGVTCLIQIIGTLLFIRRMPITYYVLGAVIQFVLITASRLSYSVVASESARRSRYRNPNAINVMVVGAGETASTVLRHFSSDEGSLVRPVCIVDCRNRDAGMLFNGLPVLGGVESIGQAIEKYGIRSAVIADSVMPDEVRKQVRELCKETGVEVQDVTAWSGGGEVGFRALMERANGTLELILDGEAQRFENSEQALNALSGRYHVKAVSAKEDRLVVELENGSAPLNNVNEAWVRDYETETGENVSFF